MAMETHPDYLTVEEAAVRAHVSSPTIRRAIKSGALRYRATRGKIKLLRVGDVDTWATGRTALKEIITVLDEG